jgi:hypothetical protein
MLDARSDRILGFTMLGAGAGEVIAAVQSAMLAGLAYTGLRDAILAHPTMAEGLSVLLAGVPAVIGNPAASADPMTSVLRDLDASQPRLHLQ